MSDMIINNMGGIMTNQSQASLLQSELAKANVERIKQEALVKGLTEELMNKKVELVRKKYSKTTVFSKKYGECKWDFSYSLSYWGAEIELLYWVKSIPTEGLSKVDKKNALLYNDAYGYRSASGFADKFKTFKDGFMLYGCTTWSFTTDEITKPDFLEKGLRAGNDLLNFSINLK